MVPEKMKTVILLLLAGATLALGKPPKIPLDPNKDENCDYGEQLILKFNALLEEDKDLKAQFAVFEAAPKERAGGRYLGSQASSLLLHRFEDVDFRDDGGRRDYTQTIVLYYSFAEGFLKGIQEVSGVFALFHVVGHQSYDHKGGGDFKLVKHTVTAKFDGFRRTLNAEEADSAQPAANPESKAEND